MSTLVIHSLLKYIDLLYKNNYDYKYFFFISLFCSKFRLQIKLIQIFKCSLRYQILINNEFSSFKLIYFNMNNFTLTFHSE